MMSLAWNLILGQLNQIVNSGPAKKKIDPNFRRSQKVKTKNKSPCEMATGIFM